MKVQTMMPNNGSVLINPSNLSQGVVFKNQHLLSNINCWHKFQIFNIDNFPRNIVLGAILDHVHPLDLIPVSYWKDQNVAYFLARNCGAAIQKLCNDNLVVPSPNSSRPFKLSITLKFATTGEFKIDVQKHILTVLSKRYNPDTKTLDLTNFYTDPDLMEFCPLSQPKIMFFVLHLSKSLVPFPERYIFANNRIKLLHPLEAFNGQYYLIKYIDLRNNLISDFNHLEQLKKIDLKELYLDGNPICENIDTQQYISEVQKRTKELPMMDGISLKAGSSLKAKQNFLCDYNGLKLVDKFLKHYFYIYDSQNRKLLQDLYHKNAMLSFTTMYHNGHLSSSTTRLYKYNNISRNLKQIADFSRVFNNLFRGNQRICFQLCSLPATEHDPYSFVTDLIYHTHRCAVIAISGVFRERPETLLDVEKLYGFRRVFTLETVNGDGLTYITNEEYHIHNALSWQQLDSFKVTKPQEIEALLLPQSEFDHQKVVECLMMITTLDTEWSKKCLEECNYDLKKALILFVDLYKQNRIPSEGFINKVANFS